MDTRPIWEVIYTLKLGFARTFIPYVLAQGNECSLLQTAYGTQDLRGWALERINQLIQEAILIRASRNITQKSLDVARALQTELVEADLWKDVKR